MASSITSTSGRIFFAFHAMDRRNLCNTSRGIVAVRGIQLYLRGWGGFLTDSSSSALRNLGARNRSGIHGTRDSTSRGRRPLFTGNVRCINRRRSLHARDVHLAVTTDADNSSRLVHGGLMDAQVWDSGHANSDLYPKEHA